MLPIKTILHPTDLSEESQPAYRAACVVARDCRARVVVAHVMARPLYAYNDFGPLIPDQAIIEGELRESLRSLRPPRHGVAVEYRLCRGDPATEIVALANDLKSDLIVLGTHGHTGLRRVVRGSVAEAVLRRAPCPVLTVRAPVPARVAPERTAKEPAHA
jgi:nucleotide-binding universal stress UspA family protein